MGKTLENPMVRASTAGLLSWLLPGLGHLYIGEKQRGIVCLVVIALTFWGGVAIGSVHGTVNPKERRLWFVAQVGSGGHALVAWQLSKRLPRAEVPAIWSSSEVGVHYTGVAGLLSLLIILDAIGRAESRHEAPPANDAATEKG